VELSDEQVLAAMIAWWRREILPAEESRTRLIAERPDLPPEFIERSLEQGCLPKEAVAEIQAAVAVRAEAVGVRATKVTRA
jgi:hypothetical protein